MPAPIAPRPAKPTRSVSPIMPSRLARGLLHRLDDSQVTGAAAEIAGERLPQVLPVGVWMIAQEGLHRHQEARRTESALERVRLVKRALERVQGAVKRQRLDGPE